MSFERDDHYPRVPDFWQRPDEHMRLVTQALNGVLDGHTNNGFFVTLEPNATETLVSPVPQIIDHAIPAFCPLSASAGAAMASGSFWVDVGVESFTIHHDSQPDTDRLFGVTVFG